mgnify:CR=1 FL=1|jgi:hypothetical protein
MYSRLSDELLRPMSYLMFSVATASVGFAVSSSPISVFGDDAIKECTRIRTPELVKSGESHWHIFATCCGENACGHKTRRRLGDNSSDTAQNTKLFDNHSEARIIMTTSHDNGLTWGKAQFLDGGKKGLEGVNAIYDTVVDSLVVQYSTYEEPKKTYQIKSKDHGKSWRDPVDLTDQLKDCPVGETAGSRVQTRTGRLLWYSGTGSCVWYSDDHGATYKTHAATAKGHEAPRKMMNEVSFAVVESSKSSQLIANGRAVFKDWKPNRIDYVSHDDGLTWVASKSGLKDPYNPDHSLNTEERALLSADSVVYTAEPKGTKDGSLRELIVSCSKDGGKTWPKSITVNGAHYAGYSRLGWLHPGTAEPKTLLVVWDHERDDVHTVGAAPLSQVIDTKWC